jgi:aryl sulfotransferase
MGSDVVERGIEREYRNVVYDNLRWERFAPRPGDIFVCTSPKCGTTWMQMIVSTLLFPDDDAPGSLWERSPWIDARFDPVEEVIGRLDAQTFRRSIKTHTPADGVPWFPQASYIVVGRDGRDAFMSMLNHMRNLQPALMMRLATSAAAEGIPADPGDRPPLEDVHEFFWWWLENRMWFDHVASFWGHHGEPNVLFVHYDDMTADLAREMQRVATFLGVDVREEQWPELTDRCTFASMKERSDKIADFESHFVGGADTFLYKASNGRWRDVLTAEELAAFDEQLNAVLPPAAVAWTVSGEATPSTP